MKTSAMTSARLGVVAVTGLLALAGCGRLNRAATINQVTTTSGSTTAVALQQQLANHGLSGAHVTCAKKMIVNVGTATSCTLTNAGSSKSVRFTFRSSHGGIDTASVKATS